MTAIKQQKMLSLCLGALALGAAGCKMNILSPVGTSSTSASSPSTTLKAKVETLMIGGANQACVAEAPLQLFFRPAELPKTLLGNISPSDASYDYVEIVYQREKNATYLFKGHPKLYMLGADGKQKPCNLTKAFIARGDWGQVEVPKKVKTDAAADKTGTDEHTILDTTKNIAEMLSLTPGEMRASFSQKSYLKATPAESSSLLDSQRCVVNLVQGKLVGIRAKILKATGAHLQIKLLEDVAGGPHPLCKKDATVYVYTPHLKGNTILLSAPDKGDFLTQIPLSQVSCSFSGAVKGRLLDYVTLPSNRSYFKIELLMETLNPKEPKDYCKKGSVGFLIGEQFEGGK